MAPDDEWDLVRAYQQSETVIVAELVRSLPLPDFKPGAVGVHIREIDAGPLVQESIVWREARELHFQVQDSFKGAPGEHFVAFQPDPHPEIWIHIDQPGGKSALLEPPVAPQLVQSLVPGDRGLFFLRSYPGTRLQVVAALRMGAAIQRDIDLLRAARQSDRRSLAQIVAEAEREGAERARAEAIEVREFEDDYYRILRIRDVEIRRSLLEDLVARMGFEGRWDYFEYKERYLEAHGRYTDEASIPSGPVEGKEKIWHDISGELRKIDAILAARRDADGDDAP